MTVVNRVEVSLAGCGTAAPAMRTMVAEIQSLHTPYRYNGVRSLNILAIMLPFLATVSVFARFHFDMRALYLIPYFYGSAVAFYFAHCRPRTANSHSNDSRTFTGPGGRLSADLRQREPGNGSFWCLDDNRHTGSGVF